MNKIHSINGLARLSVATQPRWDGTTPKAPHLVTAVLEARRLLELIVLCRAHGVGGDGWDARYDQTLAALRVAAAASLGEGGPVALAFDVVTAPARSAPFVIMLDVDLHSKHGGTRIHMTIYEFVATPAGPNAPTVEYFAHAAYLGKVVATAHLSFGVVPDTLGVYVSDAAWAGFMCSSPERALSIADRFADLVRAHWQMGAWRSVTLGATDVQWVPIQALLARPQPKGGAR